MDHAAILPGIPKTATKVIRAERCERCKWAERPQPGSPVFECHRNPPATSMVMARTGPTPVSSFALVRPDQWCGEFGTKIEGMN